MFWIQPSVNVSMTTCRGPLNKQKVSTNFLIWRNRLLIIYWQIKQFLTPFLLLSKKKKIIQANKPNRQTTQSYTEEFPTCSYWQKISKGKVSFRGRSYMRNKQAADYEEDGGSRDWDARRRRCQVVLPDVESLQRYTWINLTQLWNKTTVDWNALALKRNEKEWGVRNAVFAKWARFRQAALAVSWTPGVKVRWRSKREKRGMMAAQRWQRGEVNGAERNGRSPISLSPPLPQPQAVKTLGLYWRLTLVPAGGRVRGARGYLQLMFQC